MLNKEEKDILLKYPLFQEINVSDYLADFVMNNMDNFPISSMTLAQIYSPRDSIKSNIDRNHLKEDLIRKLISNYSEYVRFENCMNFTSSLIIFCGRKIRGSNTNTITILDKNDNDATVCLKSSNYDYSLIFNTNYDKDLIMIHEKELSLFLNYIQDKNINEIFDKKLIPCDHYYFPIKPGKTNNQSEKEMYFDRFEIFMRYITGNASRNIIAHDANNPYCTSNNVRDDTIMYYMNNLCDRDAESFSGRCFVKGKKSNTEVQVKHSTEFSNKDLLDKPVSTHYQ